MVAIPLQKNFANEEMEIEYYVLTPSMLGQFIRKPSWGIRAYYDKLYGRQRPKTAEMEEGEKLHEKHGYTNEQKFVKKFQIDPGVWVELRGKPDKIDEKGRPWEAKTLDGFFVPDHKFEAAKIQLLCYLFLMEQPYGFLDFISRETGKSVRKSIVYRDDGYLFDVIRKFIKTLRRQRQLV